jgi:hypothetical protein
VRSSLHPEEPKKDRQGVRLPSLMVDANVHVYFHELGVGHMQEREREREREREMMMMIT